MHTIIMGSVELVDFGLIKLRGRKEELCKLKDALTIVLPVVPVVHPRITRAKNDGVESSACELLCDP
jgi:hypothetical protein